MSSQRAKHQDVSALSLGLPLALFLCGSVTIAGQLGYFERNERLEVDDLVESVTIPASSFTYRADGEFYKNGFAVDGPIVNARFARPLTVMKYQVSEGEYGRCVKDAKCIPILAAHVHGADFPATGISYDDAVRYARWLSDKTGEVWTLPTHEEVAFAAGSRFPDDALGVDANSRNPALRWLADYERETRRKADANPVPRRRGTFGENEHGLADFAGNVWEWTSTCHRRVDLAGPEWSMESTACGIYVTVGQHRSPMSSFVRDPKSGGCAVGTPPSNLGFRLVRDDRWYAGLLSRLRHRGITS
jgi:formylglycine-generating enzyme required for sulfatase activity